MMRHSQTLEKSELSRDVLDSMDEMIRANIDELVGKYDAQLRKNGKRLDKGDVARLKQAIREDKLKVGMTISSSITPKLLDDWDIYPVSLNQGVLDDFKPVADIDASGSDKV